jgi:hypothetical protein
MFTEGFKPQGHGLHLALRTNRRVAYARNVPANRLVGGMNLERPEHYSKDSLYKLDYGIVSKHNRQVAAEWYFF